MLIKNENKLKKYIFNLLSKREYSRLELENKLINYTDDKNLIIEILNYFKKNNFQSDIRFCESFIYSRKNKIGNNKLIYELENQGINSDIYSDLLPNKEEEINTALHILIKKFKIYSNNLSAKQKMLNFLNSRGFSYDIAYQAIKIWSKK